MEIHQFQDILSDPVNPRFTKFPYLKTVEHFDFSLRRPDDLKTIEES